VDCVNKAPITSNLDLSDNVAFGETTFNAIVNCGDAFIYVPQDAFYAIVDIFETTVYVY
jgi:hypothetical protein